VFDVITDFVTTNISSRSAFAMVGGCCSFVVVPLLAFLVATGFVKVDITPLCFAAGKLLPTYVPQVDGKALVVPNREIRDFLKRTGLKGGAEAAGPLQGVYMFDQMGPMAWIDFSYATWNPSIEAADFSMDTVTAQSGVPAPEFGGIGPFIPGGYLLPVPEKGQYKVRFYCPAKMKDGDHCKVVESLFGQPYPNKDEVGLMLWHMTRYDGGRKYVRDTWLVPPWTTADDSYSKAHGKFHSYNLFVLMHANGTIDEEHFSRFMEKLDGLYVIKSTMQVLVCMSGDFVGPSLTSSFSKGAHIIDAMNAVGVDYATFGNHEFDYGYQSLVNRLQGFDDDAQAGDGNEEVDYPKSSATWLMTNMSEGKTGHPVGGPETKRCDITEVNGVRVGLIGLSEDYIETGREYAQKLKREGAEVVVALTHNRFDNDKKLTAEVPEIDLLLGGHDHFYKRADKKHRVVKSGEEWRWLTHTILHVGKKLEKMSVERYDVDSDVDCDPSIQELVDKYTRIRDNKFMKVICQIKAPFDATEECCRYQEGVMTNWICDAIAEDYSEKDGLQSADFAMIMGLHFAGKQVFPVGDFTLGSLMCVFPKPCQIVVLKLKGSDVIKSLERGCMSLPKECGSLHHTSAALTYKIKLGKGKAANEVTDVKVKGKAIQKDKLYEVAVTDTMAKGKFGYTWMAEAERIVDMESGMQVQDLVLMYLKRHPKQAAHAPLGRITIS
ncbi:yfkN, partial [Symbiodinium pilosum]